MRKENGIWHFERNWYLDYFWKANFRYLLSRIEDKFGWLTPFCMLVGLSGSEKKDNTWPQVPKNLCHLMQGALMPIILIPFFICASLVFGLFIYCCALAIIVISAFFGHYVVPWSTWKTSEKEKGFFYSYKYWGSKRIPVAMWEICLSAIVLYWIFKFPGEIISVVSNNIFWLVILGLCLSISFCLFLFKTKKGELFRDYLKAKKRRICPLVVIERTK